MVKEEEFNKILLSFFHNGICLRSDLFPILVAMLEDLQASIEALPTFRYYSCSLLIAYDGAVCPEGLEGVVPAIPAIDFNSITERAVKYSEELIASKRRRAEMEDHEEVKDNCRHNGLDTKYTVMTSHINGEESRAELQSNKEQAASISSLQLNGHHTEEEHRSNSIAKKVETENNVDLTKELSSVLPQQCNGEEEHCESKASPKMTREELAQARSHIDLRMIDFAHATHSGFMDPIKHTGCDDSYLKGLETLLRIFRNAEQTYCVRCD